MKPRGAANLEYIFVTLYTHIEPKSLVPEHVPVQRFAGLVHGRFPPPARVVAERTPIRDGGVQTRDFEVGVRWRRPVALLSDQPWGWHLKIKK